LSTATHPNADRIECCLISISKIILCIVFIIIPIVVIYFFFFVIAFPFSPLTSQVPCGRLVFSSLYFSYVRRGSGVLSPATHAHPTLSSPFSFLDNTTQHPWKAHPAWDLNPADLAVVSEECGSSFHHPTVSL
jgi:hypothetical protein